MLQLNGWQLLAPSCIFNVLDDSRPMDDYPYFNMDRFSTVRPQIQPDDVYNIWRSEFDGAYQEGTMFILTMHPHITGHGSRVAILERLINYMKSRPGVWFATHEEIARYVGKK